MGSILRKNMPFNEMLQAFKEHDLVDKKSQCDSRCFPSHIGLIALSGLFDKCDHIEIIGSGHSAELKLCGLKPEYEHEFEKRTYVDSDAFLTKTAEDAEKASKAKEENPTATAL